MANNDWDDNEFPLAYLITVRTYGTWLHGDERGTVDRHGKNVFGTPRMAPNTNLRRLMAEEMLASPLILDPRQRMAVDEEIKNVCAKRNYLLRALNVRTNHFHVVASAPKNPDIITTAFKSNATRALRELHLVDPDRRVWSHGKSRRYLWKPRDVANAIDYTLNQQGENLIDFDDWLKERGLE